MQRFPRPLPRVLPLVLFAFLVTTTAEAQAPPPDGDARVARTDSIFARYTRPGSPGCVAAVVRAGEIAFGRGCLRGPAGCAHALRACETMPGAPEVGFAPDQPAKAGFSPL